MSGIYGIINLKNQPIDPSQMYKMEELMIHRGVDGKSQWIDNNVGLGHLKLEITPESEYETLPLKYKQWVITADCRIDNRDELNDHLSILEAERPFTPDSTYIVKAYEKWDKDCVQHLIGDFAFAIWDTIEKTLFCARDHIGIKPFFYLKTEDKFIFASELKTIVELREIPVELNESKLGDWLYHNQDLHNPMDTLFTTIKKLMPAHIIIINNKLSIERYWELKATQKIRLLNDDAYAKRLEELMVQAVECRMRTDHKIGLTLSGGLDSSSVACIAARKLAKKGRNLYTTSSVLPNNWNGTEKDEKEYIQSIVEQESNIIPDYVSAADKGAFDYLDIIFNQIYMPVNPFYYMDMALDLSLKKQMVKVRLNGFYGDAAISYKSRLLLQDHIKQLEINHLVKIIKLSKPNFKSFGKSVIKKTIKYIIPQKVAELYVDLIKFKEHNFEKLILQPNFINKYKLDKLDKTILNKYTSKNFTYDIIYSFNRVIHSLEEINIRNAHVGLEETFPLIDIRILNYVINIPAKQLNHKGWDRGLIRFAMIDMLPNNIKWRKDKYPYSPNYLKKLESSIKNISDILNDNVENKYIDIFRLKHYLSLTNSLDNKYFKIKPILLGFMCINTFFINFYNTKFGLK